MCTSETKTKRGRKAGVPNPHGGRHPIYNERMKQVTLSMTEEMLEFLDIIGDGNKSRGARTMYQFCLEKNLAPTQ